MNVTIQLTLTEEEVNSLIIMEDALARTTDGSAVRDKMLAAQWGDNAGYLREEFASLLKKFEAAAEKMI